MRNKKDEKPAGLNPDQQLEAKVDAMMDVSAGRPEQQESEVQKAESPQGKNELPPLDIFSDPSTAPDVPKSLLKQLDNPNNPAITGKTPVAEEPDEAETKTTDASIDDAATDAAIDDIVAHESDDSLATEDKEREEAAAVTQPAVKVRKIHHHPIFWTIIFLICLVAFVAAYLLITGGSNLPGSGFVNNLSQH